MYTYIIIIIIIISDNDIYSVDDRDHKPRYGIEVLLNLSIYLPALGNDRINSINLIQKRININKYFAILILFIRVLSHKKSIQYIKYISQYQ